MRNLILFSALILSVSYFAGSLSAEEKILKYGHYKRENNKRDGYTVYLIKKDRKGKVIDIQFFKESGDIYASEHFEFDSAGNVVKYNGEDFRENYKIKMNKDGIKYRSELEVKDEKFHYEMESKKLAVMSSLLFYVEDNINEILNSRKFTFSLFIPAAFYELASRGLPKTLSIISCAVEKKSKKGSDILNLRIYPDSFFLRRVLPNDKQEFTVQYNKKTSTYVSLITSDYIYRLE